MEIFKWELKKIIRRRAVKIALILAVCYVIFAAIYNAVVNLGSNDGYGHTNADGISEIARQYKFADKYKGDLTEDKLISAYHDLIAAYSEENLVKSELDGSINPSQEAWDKYVVPLGTMQYVLRRVYQLIPEYSYFNSIIDVPEDMIGNYYGVRKKITDDFIFSQISDEKDREFFLEQNEKISVPYHYDWYDGQAMYLEILAPVPVIAALVCAVFSAPIYASEYSGKTDSIILASRYGKRKIAKAKLLAVLAFSALTYILCVGIYVIGQLIFVGTRALDCPIQFIKSIAQAPLTIWQAELYQIVLGFVCCMAITAFTALVSSYVKSSFPAVIVSLSVIFIPMLISGGIPEKLEFITAVIPFMSDYTELFRTNMYFHIWSPYLMAISPIIIFLICLPFAAKGFECHQVM